MSFDVKRGIRGCGGPRPKPRPVYLRWLPVAVALVGLVSLGAICDELYGRDTRPPDCRIIQPVDSALVSGQVTIVAEAFDTSGVREVEFYVNDLLIATRYASPYTAVWDASGLPNESRHRIFCLASDIYNNVGSSDTISVQVRHGGQQGIIHAAFRLDNNRYRSAGFVAGPGDTLVGDGRALGGRALSWFLWLDAANYARFRTAQGYTTLLELQDRVEFSVREPVAAADSFYLVFLNTSGSPVDFWARFTLER